MCLRVCWTVCAAKADIGFIVDQSTSIVLAPGGNDNWNSILNFVQQVIQSFSISPTLTRVGMVRFSTNASFEFGFTSYSDAPSLILNVSSLQIRGGQTNYADAFRSANTNLWPNRRTDVKTICIFITDGNANEETDKTFIEVNKTKELGIEVYAIGVTNQVNLPNIHI